MTRQDRIGVVIADDHPLFLVALEDAVRSHPELQLMASADDGRGALAAIREREPAVAVVDIRMPALDGNQVLSAVMRDELPTRVLICAAATESHAVYDCLAGGAAGYLDKGADAGEICDAIVRVARGETVLSERLWGGVLHQIGRRSRPAAERLTPRERQVLGLLANGLSGPQIAAELFVEPSTIKTHLGNLYDKLGVSDRAAAVAEGMRRGLLE